MAITTPPTDTERESELIALEEQALEHLAEEGIPEEETLPAEEGAELEVPLGRLAGVVAMPTLAAAVMVGGIFNGTSPRFWAGVAGILGVLLATQAIKIRSAVLMNIAIAAGIVLIGVILTFPAGSFSDVVNPLPFVREAVTSGDVLRPPVDFTLGWRDIVGWLMGGLGFAAAWIAIQFRRPALGLLAPMPIVAVAAISVASNAKLPSGLASLALFGIGLGLLSGIEMEGEQRSLAFELRRAARALPMVGAITGLMYLATQVNFLFPRPIFDPTQEAQRPRTVPLTEVPDRVLFTVKAAISGPWRMGGLDVYQDGEWLLPPFAENRIREVPRSGLVDTELTPGQAANFEVKDLGGAVLPGLPNLVGIIADFKPAYDLRTGNIRLAEGTVQPGLKYTVTAARIPTVDELRNVGGPLPREGERFLDIPPPPRAVGELIARAPEGSAWDRLDFVRLEFLKTVVAKGAGTPVAVPPEKVADMLAGSKEGTPFEIVAGQAMLARWVGIPSRIGYGFDGGDKVGDAFEVRPRHGATYLEVYFPGYKWLPVIGTPLQARATVGSEFTQRTSDVLPSDDISVQVFVPYQRNPGRYLFEQIRQVVFIVVPIIVLLLLLYYTFPALRKAVLRSRRRRWALTTGPHERIAVAYAEWRDLCADFGYQNRSDTPLMFLDRVVADEEHTELAWLVTRCLWGDLYERVRPEDAAAAEELSRSLRKRMGQAHTATLRTIAAVSRVSLRYPFAPTLEPRKAKRRDVRKAA